jgi:hypothetical protein
MTFLALTDLISILNKIERSDDIQSSIRPWYDCALGA